MLNQYSFTPVVSEGFADARGNWVRSNPDTVDSLRATMAAHAAASSPYYRTCAHEPLSLPSGSQLSTAHGRAIHEQEYKAGLSPGFYMLQLADGSPAPLWAVPTRCAMPKLLENSFGLSLQAYALRGEAGTGYGRFFDVGQVAQWASSLGASFLVLAPVGAPTPVVPIESSPYFPSSRRFLNPLHLDPATISHHRALVPTDNEPWLEAGKALNQTPAIERDQAWRMQLRALWHLFSHSASDASFSQFCARAGEPLRQFGIFSCLATYFGRDWRSWPAALGVTNSHFRNSFLAAHEQEITFHMWIQWQLHRQLASVSSTYPLIHDFPVGVDPGGADAWRWQNDFLHGFSIGAPPDTFSPRGQDWTVEPPDPAMIFRNGAALLRESVGAMLRVGRGIRIDHVMGLWRLYCIPNGAPATEGAYLSYPYEMLLDSLAILSHEADAVIVGEDLGTVEPAVREALDDRGIVRYKLAWFDRPERDAWSREGCLTLGAVSTHDLPTIAGVITGEDVADQLAAGLTPDPDINRALLACTNAICPGDKTVSETVIGMHQALRAAAPTMAAASLEDCLGITRRPNLPGTTSTVRANWSAPYPVSVERLPDEPLPRQVMAALAKQAAPVST